MNGYYRVQIVRSFDRLTVAAVGVTAFLLTMFVHEAVGHGSAATVFGRHVSKVTNWYCRLTNRNIAMRLKRSVAPTETLASRLRRIGFNVIVAMFYAQRCNHVDDTAACLPVSFETEARSLSASFRIGLVAAVYLVRQHRCKFAGILSC